MGHIFFFAFRLSIIWICFSARCDVIEEYPDYRLMLRTACFFMLQEVPIISARLNVMTFRHMVFYNHAYGPAVLCNILFRFLKLHAVWRSRRVMILRRNFLSSDWMNRTCTLQTNQFQPTNLIKTLTFSAALWKERRSIVQNAGRPCRTGLQKLGG